MGGKHLVGRVQGHPEHHDVGLLDFGELYLNFTFCLKHAFFEFLIERCLQNPLNFYKCFIAVSLLYIKC